MDIQEIRNNLELLPDLIQDKEFDYREAKALLDDMEDRKKTLLARLKVKHTGSNPEREMKALASDEYEIHLNGISEQKKIVAKKQSEYDYLVNKFEAMRSLNKNV